MTRTVHCQSWSGGTQHHALPPLPLPDAEACRMYVVYALVQMLCGDGPWPVPEPLVRAHWAWLAMTHGECPGGCDYADDD